MDKFKKKNRRFVFILTTTILSLTIGSGFFNVFEDKSSSDLNAAELEASSSIKPMNEDLRSKVNEVFSEAKNWPQSFDYKNKKVRVEYNFNNDLEEHIKKLLRRYGSDYSTVVVMDNETGKVLTAVGYEGRSKRFNTNLVLTSTHPSASLIKMVTAAELMENTKVKKETNFEYRGKSTTLFRYQLNSAKKNKWDRLQTFERAFAVSNNVIFGKAAIEHIPSSNLVKMAENFGFNQSLVYEMDFLQSKIGYANDDYHLAEIASGFNTETVISPIHAVHMAGITANHGIAINPKIIARLVDDESGDILWENATSSKRVLSSEASKEMQEMMLSTVKEGTARKSFRKLRRSYVNSLEIGGKTGSITGGKPFGKRDWFSAYAVPSDIDKGKGISISIMNVNVKKWYVKSTHLAKEIIEFYYGNIHPESVVLSAPGQALAMDSVRTRAPAQERRAVKKKETKSRSKQQVKKRSSAVESKKKSKKSNDHKIGKRNDGKSKSRI